MKQFMQKTIAVLLALALFCGMVPAAFAADAQYYTIRLDACGGVDVPMELSTTAEGRLVELPTPVMKGYTFDGWYTDLAAGERVTSDTVFESDSTIYAYWIADSVKAETAESASGIRAYLGTIVVTGITVFSLMMLAVSGNSAGDGGVAVL